MNKLYLTRHEQIDANEILYLQGERNYTSIHTTNRPKIMSSHTLGVLEARLDTSSFIRVSRGCVINTFYLSTYRHENNKLIIQLAGGQEFTASRRRLKILQSMFKKQRPEALSWHK